MTVKLSPRRQQERDISDVCAKALQGSAVHVLKLGTVYDAATHAYATGGREAAEAAARAQVAEIQQATP